jgi:CRISPR-associated protein Cmr2
MVDRHLLLVSLGPIQDFIASARRCQDLWFGSWLLSALARESALAIGEASGSMKTLVFPADLGREGDERPAVANKILACVEADPGAVAEAGRAAMERALEACMRTAFARVGQRYFLRARAEEQVRELIEYVWVSVPLGENDYADARARAERLLAARKACRTWEAVRWGAPVPKSSLDGLRESVLDEQLFDAETPDTLRTSYFVRKGERLCGVGLLKRVGADIDFDDEGGPTTRTWTKRPLFHSTSHVAAAPIRARIAAWPAARRHEFDAAMASFEGVLREILGERLRELRVGGRTNGPLDGSVFYEGQIPAIIEEHAGQVPGVAPRTNTQTEDAAKRLRDGLRAFLKSLDLHAESVPTYFAVLQADGDRMGATLDEAGRVAAGRDAGIDGQRAVARALDEFSLGCRAIVELHGGSLVYAGGDDVLAFVPLHTALACARALADDFARRMTVALADLRVKTVPSLSVGLGISHHLEDMADARALAQRAEREAKKVDGKNALAIVAQLRSGGRLSVAGSWSPPSGDAIDARIAAWIDHLRADEIPGKAAHDLAAAVAPLRALSGASRVSNEVVRSAANRVWRRKRAAHGSDDLSATVGARLERALAGPDALAAVDSLVTELQLAALFAKAVDVANPPDEASSRGEAVSVDTRTEVRS